MILADTNVLLDVFGRDPVWADWSRQQLNAAATIGEIAINDTVYAELSAGYRRFEEVDALIGRAGIVLVRTPRPALFLAGKVFQRYRAAGGARTGVLPDFFIGAHAVVSESPLITREVHRYRTYFPGLALIAPD